MNRFQLVIVVVAAVNILLMLLFPPYLNNPLGLLTPRGFDGFYFFFAAPPNHPIQTDLLSIEILFVFANALAAWLGLADNGSAPSQAGITAGLVAFGVVDFAIVGLFPPFEAYQSMVRIPPVGFDGFYFIFGDKMHRPIFAPLLYLECILIAVDLLSAWLLLGIAGRQLSATDEELLEIAHHLPPEKLAALENAMRHQSHAPNDEEEAQIGRHGDRRHHADPNYSGPERRHGDRRHHAA